MKKIVLDFTNQFGYLKINKSIETTYKLINKNDLEMVNYEKY